MVAEYPTTDILIHLSQKGSSKTDLKETIQRGLRSTLPELILSQKWDLKNGPSRWPKTKINYD